MKKIQVLFSTMILQMKNSFVRPMFKFCLIANPIINTILLYEMSMNSKQENFMSSVILGAGLMGIWSCICFSSAGDINRERWSGTLSIIYTTPADFRLIILGKILGNTFLSLLTFGISYLTAWAFFKGKFIIKSGERFAVAFIAMIICFAVISVMIAYLLTLSRKTTLYMNLIEYPIILLCGFVFPVEILPVWVQKISNILPPTWAIKLLRVSIKDASSIIYMNILCKLIISTLIYGLISMILFRIIDRQVRIEGTLEMS